MKRMTKSQNELAEELFYHAAEIIRYTLYARASSDPKLQEMRDDVNAINARIIAERQEQPIIDSLDFELILAALQRFYRQAEKMTAENQTKHPGWRDPMKTRMVRATALIDKLIQWHNESLEAKSAENYMYVDLSWDLSNYDDQTKELLRLATTPDFDRDDVGQADPGTSDDLEVVASESAEDKKLKKKK